ncbi:MAG: chaperonin GroEL [Candidatus Paceibacterota bacterium]
MSKQLKFNEDARVALAKGVSIVADAVRATIGPRGRNVVLDKGYGAPMITNDGVSIARDITLPDRFENMGAEIVKEVATKTNDVAGDGTSTATILTDALVREGLKHTRIGVNAMGVRNGIERASRDVVEALKSIAKPIPEKSKSEIKNVATISAESAEIGEIIAETINKVGKDGVVTVEESQSFGVESDIVEGLQFEKGYVSPYMITNAERMEAEFKDAPILVTDKKISVVKDVLPLLEKLAQTGTKELVIIADDVDGEALTTFVLNKLRGGFNVLAVKAPGYGDRKKENLEDIAVTIGATVISEDVGLKLEQAQLAFLGHANRVIATKNTTTIVGGKGKKQGIQSRIEQIRKQISQTESKFDREKLEERMAKLSGGVAVIRVGATTETEMKYLKLKIEDAVNATKAAIEEGIVPGGGSALVRAGELVRKSIPKNITNEEKIGYEIVLRALEEPLRQIIANGGREDGAVIVSEIQKGKGMIGYDALKDEMVADMLSAGIIDPVKVTRSGIERASSAAAILLTTEVAITDIPEPKQESAGSGSGMGGGMGMM